MNKILRVLVPLHVTCIWRVVWGRDYLDTGSIGAGLNLGPCTYLEVRPWSRDVVSINGRELYLRHVTLARELLGVRSPLRVDCLTLGDLGVGYALSSAVTIASSLYAHTLGIASLERCLDVAHIVEVKLRTGLGDVAAQTSGGEIEIRVKPGAPSRAAVRRINIKEKVTVIIAELQGGENTPEMLALRYARIQQASAKLISKVLDVADLDTLLELASTFSREVGFLSENIERELYSLRSWIRGMFVKKRLLVIVPERDRAQDVAESLSSSSLLRDVKFFALCDRGVTVVH